MKKTSIVGMIVLAVFLCSSVALAEWSTWHIGTISAVQVRGDGTVSVVLYETASETDFRKFLIGTEWKAMLAAILSAKANDSTVRMRRTTEGWDRVEILDY